MIKRIIGLLVAIASLAIMVLTALRYGSHTSLVARPDSGAAPALTQPTPQAAPPHRMQTARQQEEPPKEAIERQDSEAN